MSDYSKTKICEACHEPFGCGVDSRQCWCFDAPMSPDRLRELQNRYNDCLCPKCLLEFSKKQ